jgi:hypothetical protein
MAGEVTTMMSTRFVSGSRSDLAFTPIFFPK